MSTRSDTELAATITTQQPAPIKSDVTMLNTMIHSTANSSTLSMTAAAMRRAGLLLDARRAAGSGEFMTGIPHAMRIMSSWGRKSFNAEPDRRCLAIAQHEIDRVSGNPPKLGLVTKGAFEHGQSARHGDNV